VLEYAGRRGKPRWVKPACAQRDYTRFGKPGTTVAPDELIEMTFAKRQAAAQGFNVWALNGAAFEMARMEVMFRLRLGKRYRLRLHNASDDIHPLHLHCHSFELTKIAGKSTHFRRGQGCGHGGRVPVD